MSHTTAKLSDIDQRIIDIVFGYIRALENNRIPIKIMFKMIGAADAAANLLCEFKIAEKNDAKLIKNKNGKVILVKSVASLIFSLSSTNPGAIKPTKTGMNTSTTKTKNNKPQNNKLKISLANLFELDLPFTNSEV